ncbi:radical sam [Lucifera butyrica]|uniref:Radical sam n=1 Tax=Lucifera butyrica TaxID=1351585 RepID=A0A498RE67_9FIRM|nr:radical SAM protein [Lucifera butyrica]VBB09794.1 radical sam [Lucifera butyrica]
MKINGFPRYWAGGGTGQVIWAITNVCNAKCGFCSYPKNKTGAARYVTFEEARQVLDELDRRNLKMISFTGGEPLMNPDLFAMIDYAGRKGFLTRTGTNGSMLNPVSIARLKAAGIRNVWISLDSEDEAKHDRNRGIPGLAAHVREMIPLMLRQGLSVNIAAPVNRLIGDFTAFARHVRDLGLNTIAFCYPMTAMESSYGGAAASSLVDFSPAELVEALTAIKKLKASAVPGIRIVNPLAGLDEMIRFVRQEPPLFPCLGGHKFFYLDWDLILYRCAFLRDNFGHVLGITDWDFPATRCNQCMWQCFRDPSVYYYLPQMLQRLFCSNRSGWLKSAGAVFNSEARLSASAWLELIKNNFYR